jgi:peptide/nickel transport system permease protein
MAQLVKPVTATPTTIKHSSLGWLIARRFFASKTNLAAFSVLALITLTALGANFIAGILLGQAYDSIDLKMIHSQPGQPPYPPGLGGHILGTDFIARDVLARTIYGGQVSLAVGYLTAVIVIVVGGGLGLLTGYFGGWVDAIIGGLMQVLVNLPVFFLMIILSFIVRFTILNIALIIGLLSWVGTARLVRGQVLSLRNREFIEAARVMGASNWRIMFVHLVPNMLLPLVVMAGFDVGAAVVLEAGLSVLGFGVQIPIPSWGNQIAQGLSDWEKNPALWALFLTLFSLYLVANGLRDALDPDSQQFKAAKKAKAKAAKKEKAA